MLETEHLKVKDDLYSTNFVCYHILNFFSKVIRATLRLIDILTVGA